MARVELTTHIAAPIERVFDLSLDIDLHLRSMARSDEQAIAGVTRGQIGLGEEVTWRARHFGRIWTMTSRIVELERPSFFADEEVDGPFRAFRHEHRFRSEGDGTLMVDLVTFGAPLAWLSDPTLRIYLRRLLERRNTTIATWAESG